MRKSHTHAPIVCSHNSTQPHFVPRQYHGKQNFAGQQPMNIDQSFIELEFNKYTESPIPKNIRGTKVAGG